MLGSIQRYELERMLLLHLSPDATVSPDELRQLIGESVTEVAAPDHVSDSLMTLDPAQPPVISSATPRFHVFKVDGDRSGGGDWSDVEAQLPATETQPCFLQVVSRFCRRVSGVATYGCCDGGGVWFQLRLLSEIWSKSLFPLCLWHQMQK